jgi:hypothetical protein
LLIEIENKSFFYAKVFCCLWFIIKSNYRKSMFSVLPQISFLGKFHYFFNIISLQRIFFLERSIKRYKSLSKVTIHASHYITSVWKNANLEKNY